MAAANTCHLLAPAKEFGHGYTLVCPRCGREGHGVIFEQKRPESKPGTPCPRSRARFGQEPATT